MFDLVFLFTGLCAFALEPARTSPAERLDVVLVDAQGHVGMLVVEPNQVAASQDMPPSTPFGSHIGYPLKGKIVRILNGASGKITWTASSSTNGCPVNATDLSSYDWVVQMNKLSRGSGRILDTMRNPSRVTLPSKFHAKVELEAGTLAVRSVARNQQGGILKWEFNESKPDSFQTARADLVELRQPRFPEAQVITLQFDDLALGRSGLLTLKANGRPEVLIEVFNMPEEDICCTRPETFQTGQYDTHFAHLFDLLPASATVSKPKVVGPCGTDVPDPTISGACSRTCGPPGVGNPQCPGSDQSDP